MGKAAAAAGYFEFCLPRVPLSLHTGLTTVMATAIQHQLFFRSK